MSLAIDINDQEQLEGDPLQIAIGLLSQQTWCWGQDILRPEGNWLLEFGFDRLEPPTNRKDSSSLYTLDLPQERCVVLRGFGLFYGDPVYGGVFLPRYEFQPMYTKEARMACPPWSNADLPHFDTPSESQRCACVTLTLDVIDWIRSYEVSTIERLGLGYRRETLTRWGKKERSVTPAEKMASAWRELSFQVAANFGSFSR